MALAKRTSVLREAMLLSFEPRCFGAAEYADICESHANINHLFEHLFVTYFMRRAAGADHYISVVWGWVSYDHWHITHGTSTRDQTACMVREL